MVYRVKEPFSFDDPQGVPITLRVGALLEDSDPRVKGHERFLEPAEKAAQRSAVSATETATAAPGERRDVRSPHVDGLREQLVAKGVKVDGRWSEERLRAELAKVTEQ